MRVPSTDELSNGSTISRKPRIKIFSVAS